MHVSVITSPSETVYSSDTKFENNFLSISRSIVKLYPKAAILYRKTLNHTTIEFILIAQI